MNERNLITLEPTIKLEPKSNTITPIVKIDLSMIKYYNKVYLDQIRERLIECRVYLETVIHKSDIKYIAYPQDILLEYNSRRKHVSFSDYKDLPKLTKRQVEYILNRWYYYE